MSCYLRSRVAGQTVFFTVRLAAEGSSLLTDEVERLRVAVRQTQAERPFGVAAWVVLPDHMHCLWTLPEGDADHPVRWGAIKARFSMDLRRAGFTPPPRQPMVKSGRHGGVNPARYSDKGEVAIWQRRYWEHHIRNDEDFADHVRYCWVNPVKHGFVERPEDWPFSSVHRDIRSGLYQPGYESGSIVPRFAEGVPG
ncbi:MAG: transposase [Rhodobacterales bacterium]|nr:transposase [Rhodobacterales bacterium]